MFKELNDSRNFTDCASERLWFAMSCLIGVCFTMLTLLPLCLRVLKARIARPQREILWVEYHERVG